MKIKEFVGPPKSSDSPRIRRNKQLALGTALEVATPFYVALGVKPLAIASAIVGLANLGSALKNHRLHKKGR